MQPVLMVGGNLGLNMNSHNPNFDIPQSVVPLSTFTSTGRISNGSIGTGLYLGGLFEYRFTPTIGISTRLGYNNASGNVTGVGSTKDTANNAVQTAQTIEASLSYLDISALAQFHNPFNLRNFYGLAGFNYGFLLSGSYNQTETPTSPANAQLSGGSLRTFASGATIPDASNRFAFALGAGYNIPINKTTYISPEILWIIPFGQISGNTGTVKFDSWSVSQIRLGFSLKFDMNAKTDKTPDKEFGVVMNEVGYYDETGNYNKVSTIKVEDIQYSEMYPLVPSVFFAKESAEISDKFQTSLAGSSKAGDYSLTSLPQDAVEINRNSLNIIGARLKLFPNANLKIIGTNDGKDETMEISEQRAATAKQYLISTFGISSDRITTSAQNLPEKPSAKTLTDGDEENRRVEFSSNVPEIVEPIIIHKDKQRLAQPNLLEFRPKVVNVKSPVVSHTFMITQAGKTLREDREEGEPRIKRWVIRPDELSASQLPIEYHLTVKNQDGVEKEANGTIPVDYISSTRKAVEKMQDRTIEKFSLILFDFDKADLTAENQRILEKTVIPSLKYNSVVKIYGYTDRTGDAKYNKELSRRRAEKIKEALFSKAKTAKYELTGVGKDLLIFDNDSPVGRQLCRTVQIIVETPTK